MDRRSFVSAALGLSFMVPAFAQTPWPTRNVTIVVPFPPGGQADLAARPIALALEKSLGRPVIVDNRQGAGGALGNAAVAKAEPDGHTLLMTLSSLVVLPEADRLFEKKPLYELDQLVPVARVLADPTVLAVLSSSPWRSVQDLVADAKKRPREIAYSSSGSYGASHVPMNMFTQAAGIELQHVPYRGGGPALTALIGNQVATLASAPGPLAPHIAAGTVRVLASWAGARTPELADVPTFRELGYGDVEFYIWAGLFAPKGTPEPVIARLRTAMREAAQSPQVTAVFEKAGSPPAYLDAPEFASFIAADSTRLIPAVRRIGKVE
jgi:tripartite-type tricarboxylate transporter receptor subunit TctC